MCALCVCRERTTSRRLAALNLLAAELAAKQQTAEAAASAAAAAASSDKGASTAEAGVSDTYRELAEAHVDLEDLDGLVTHALITTLHCIDATKYCVEGDKRAMDPYAT